MLWVSVYLCTCVDYVLYHIDVFIEISSFKEALTDQTFGVFDSPLPMSDLAWRRRCPFPVLWHSVGVWRTLSHYPQSWYAIPFLSAYGLRRLLPPELGLFWGKLPHNQETRLSVTDYHDDVPPVLSHNGVNLSKSPNRPFSPTTEGLCSIPTRPGIPIDL